jgi:hypothetical protein
VTIHRVYLRPEHITEAIVDLQAIPYVWTKPTASATRAALTGYNEFSRLTGGIYKRYGRWVRFPRNGDGQYEVPVFTDSAEGYELYRVELDNFEDAVLLELLIDALEPFIDGAQYYYVKARQLWRAQFERAALEAAQERIREAANEKVAAYWTHQRDTERRVVAKYEELTAPEEELIEAVEQTCEFHVGQLENDIDDIQAAIDRLEDQKTELEARQAALRERAEGMAAFIRRVQAQKGREVLALQRSLETVEQTLTQYEDAQVSEQSAAVTAQFDPHRRPIEDVIDFSRHRPEVVARARSGAESFEARLSPQEHERIRGAAAAEVERQRAEVTVAPPELPSEDVHTMDEILHRIDAVVDQLQAQELEDVHDLRRLVRLRRMFVDGSDAPIDWDNWEG